MGHDFITFEGRSQMLHDLDIWMLRHFLLAEAEAFVNEGVAADTATLAELVEFCRGWEWIGVGVYLGLDLGEFVRGSAKRKHLLRLTFRQAMRRIRSHGREIPLDYLREHVNGQGFGFTSPQETERVAKAVGKLETLSSAPA